MTAPAQIYTIAQAYGFPTKTPVTIECEVTKALGTRDRNWSGEAWVEHRFLVRDATSEVELGISKLHFDVPVGMFLRCGPSSSGTGGTNVRKWSGQSGDKWEISTYGSYIYPISGLGGERVAHVSELRALGSTPVVAPPSVAPTAPSPSVPPRTTSDIAYEHAVRMNPPPVTVLTERPAAPLQTPRLTVADHFAVQLWLVERWRNTAGIDLVDEAMAALVNTAMIALTNGKIEEGILEARLESSAEEAHRAGRERLFPHPDAPPPRDDTRPMSDAEIQRTMAVKPMPSDETHPDESHPDDSDDVPF